MNLKQETISEIEKLINSYPHKKSAAMMCMHIVQEELGYLDKNALNWIAQKLEIDPIGLFGMLSFYPSFTDEKLPKAHIKICKTLSCALNGSIKIAEDLSKELNVEIGKTSSDGQFKIEFVECLGNCGKGANVQVNDKLYEKVSPDAVKEFADEIKNYLASNPKNPSCLDKPYQNNEDSSNYFKG